jgi:hypothetical protein
VKLGSAAAATIAPTKDDPVLLAALWTAFDPLRERIGWSCVMTRWWGRGLGAIVDLSGVGHAARASREEGVVAKLVTGNVQDLDVGLPVFD